jgi:hypothetical protein
MSLLAVLALLPALMHTPAPQTQPAGLPEPLRAHIGGEAFAPLTTVAALPKGLKDELARLFREKSLQLADPGAPFNATDVVGPKLLPFRRLIAAGCAGDHCLVHYEKGGFAHVYQVVVLSRQGDTLRFVWGGSVAGPIPSVQAVRDALAAQKVLGQKDYW